MALNLPNFLGLPLQGNPYVQGVAQGQELAGKGLENYVAGQKAPYAGPEAFLKARHQELVNQALPLQYIMQYSKDPLAIITALLSGNAGDIGKNLANQMMNISGSQTNLPLPHGYMPPATSSMPIDNSGNVATNSQQPSRTIPQTIKQAAQQSPTLQDVMHGAIGNIFDKLTGANKMPVASARNENEDKTIVFDEHKPIRIFVPWLNKTKIIHQKDVSKMEAKINDWNRTHKE